MFLKELSKQIPLECSYRKAMDKTDVHWSFPYSSNGVWNCLLH